MQFCSSSRHQILIDCERICEQIKFVLVLNECLCQISSWSVYLCGCGNFTKKLRRLEIRTRSVFLQRFQSIFILGKVNLILSFYIRQRCLLCHSIDGKIYWLIETFIKFSNVNFSSNKSRITEFFFQLKFWYFLDYPLKILHRPN